jgi:ATP-dependent Zn protease
VFWLVVIAVSLLLSQRFSVSQQSVPVLIFDEFLAQLESGKVKYAQVEDKVLHGAYSQAAETSDDKTQFDFKTILPTNVDFTTLERWRRDYGIKLEFKENTPNFGATSSLPCHGCCLWGSGSISSDGCKRGVIRVFSLLASRMPRCFSKIKHG